MRRKRLSGLRMALSAGLAGAAVILSGCMPDNEGEVAQAPPLTAKDREELRTGQEARFQPIGNGRCFDLDKLPDPWRVNPPPKGGVTPTSFSFSAPSESFDLPIHIASSGEVHRQQKVINAGAGWPFTGRHAQLPVAAFETIRENLHDDTHVAIGKRYRYENWSFELIKSAGNETTLVDWDNKAQCLNRHWNPETDRYAGEEIFVDPTMRCTIVAPNDSYYTVFKVSARAVPALPRLADTVWSDVASTITACPLEKAASPN